MAAVTGWDEVADRVWVRRYDPFDVNVTVVAGERQVLLVDTRTSLHEAAELRDHLRELPVGPVDLIALTHAHLDHCLGAGAFPGVPVWASTGCRRELQQHGIASKERWLTWLPEERHAHLRASPVPVPERTVRDRHRLELGGREVDLLVPGRGHTDHDLVLHVADASVVLAGDLIEVGAPPSFEDAYPFEWPATLTTVETLGARVTVPGHGAPASEATVATQREELAHLAALCREAVGGLRTREHVLQASPFPAEATTAALDRAAVTLGA